MAKFKTNKQSLNQLIKEVENYHHLLGPIVLRERLLLIAGATLTDIDQNPEGWVNPAISADVYKDIMNIIIKVLETNQ